jgi:hypothetical protein
MGTYLNVGSALLPPDVAEEDPVVVDARIDEVEADIIDVYRVREGDTFYVMLYGYDSDDPSAVRTAFSAAMERVVAHVVTHRMRHLDDTGNLKAESEGRRSRTYRDAFDPRWPKAWQAPLVKYDLRTRAHVV